MTRPRGSSAPTAAPLIRNVTDADAGATSGTCTCNDALTGADRQPDAGGAGFGAGKPEQSSAGWPMGWLIAIGAGASALVALGGFLLAVVVAPASRKWSRRSHQSPSRRRRPPPSGHLNVPARRRVVEETAPKLEITLIPKRVAPI